MLTREAVAPPRRIVSLISALEERKKGCFEIFHRRSEKSKSLDRRGTNTPDRRAPYKEVGPPFVLNVLESRRRGGTAIIYETQVLVQMSRSRRCSGSIVYDNFFNETPRVNDICVPQVCLSLRFLSVLFFPLNLLSRLIVYISIKAEYLCTDNR